MVDELWESHLQSFNIVLVKLELTSDHTESLSHMKTTYNMITSIMQVVNWIFPYSLALNTYI